MTEELLDARKTKLNLHKTALKANHRKTIILTLPIGTTIIL